jgi:hypothetical protein
MEDANKWKSRDNEEVRHAPWELLRRDWTLSSMHISKDKQ